MSKKFEMLKLISAMPFQKLRNGEWRRDSPFENFLSRVKFRQFRQNYESWLQLLCDSALLAWRPLSKHGRGPPEPLITANGKQMSFEFYHQLSTPSIQATFC